MPEQNRNLMEATNNSGKDLYKRMKNNPPTQSIIGQIEAVVSHVCGELDWQEILNQNGLGDVMTDMSYNEDYSHGLNLTIKEIRQITNIINTTMQTDDSRKSG